MFNLQSVLYEGQRATIKNTSVYL